MKESPSSLVNIFDGRASSWRSGSTGCSRVVSGIRSNPLFWWSLVKNDAFFHWRSCKLSKSVKNFTACWRFWVPIRLVHAVGCLVNFFSSYVVFHLMVLLQPPPSTKTKLKHQSVHTSHETIMHSIIMNTSVERSQSLAIQIDYMGGICYVLIPFAMWIFCRQTHFP